MLPETIRAVSVMLTAAGALAFADIRIDASSADIKHVGVDAGVVLIQVVSTTGDSLYGNGVVVAPGTVATERALLENAQTVGIISATDRAVLPATLMRVDTTTNVALLRATGLGADAIRMATQPMRAGDSVTVLSIRPGDLAPVSVYAMVSSIEAFVGVELAQLSSSPSVDVLGAPVVNESGALVGIAFTTRTQGVAETFAIPSRHITELLYPPVATNTGATPTRRPRSTAPTTPATPASTTSASSRSATAVTSAARAGNAAPQLEITGLLNARIIEAFANGAFAAVEMEREDPRFVSMLQSYLDACAVRCEATLPANRVEMMQKRCTEKTTEYNGYGFETQSYCSQSVTEGRGLYADPLLYSALRALELPAANRALKDAMKMAFQPNMLDNMFSLIGNERAIADDMSMLVHMNKCASPAIKQFEDNILQFALGKQPRWVNGVANTGPGSGAPQAADGPFVDGDYVKLMDDLIVAQSRSWAMHRYSPGSVTRVEVSARDAAGRPTSLLTHYTFEGLNGYTAGTVRVAFTDGLPECMYFFDSPGTCRTPNQRIISRYINGEYQKK